MKTIKLAYAPQLVEGKGIQDQYKVVTVKNSTVYNPGQRLAKAEVDDLCDNSRWDVTIVPLDASKS